MNKDRIHYLLLHKVIKYQLWFGYIYKDYLIQNKMKKEGHHYIGQHFMVVNLQYNFC